MKLAGLYAITTDQFSENGGTLINKVEQALQGGANLIQYRDKTSNQKQRLLVASKLQQLCLHHQKPLIINDDIELALNCNAAGVHLGENDADLAIARSNLPPNSIIGVSCYNDLNLALSAQENGASYIAFGSFYQSKTKPAAVIAELELLKRASQTLTIPICAIGGITSENTKPLINAGANMVAVISDIFCQSNAQQAAKNIACQFS